MNREACLAWLAGVFEGEGHISLVRSGGQWFGTVGITQRNELFIRGVISLARECNLPEPNVNQPTFHVLSYSLVWSAVKGSKFLLAIRPYFHHPHRMARADIYLRFFDVKRVHAKHRTGERRQLFEEWQAQQQLEKDEKAREPNQILI